MNDSHIEAGIIAGIETAKRFRKSGHEYTAEYEGMAIAQDAISAYLDELRKAGDAPVYGVTFGDDGVDRMVPAPDGEWVQLLYYKAVVAELDEAQKALAASLPKLPNCGRYLAEDNTGQWHYLNHADEWQPYQGPTSGLAAWSDLASIAAAIPSIKAGYAEGTGGQDLPFILSEVAKHLAGSFSLPSSKLGDATQKTGQSAENAEGAGSSPAGWRS